MPSSSMSTPLIDFRRVSVARGDATVLHDLTLRIGVGEHVAILGPNGCGKSTLIKTITRECYPLRNPDSSLSILGQSTWHLLDLRRQLGIVTHDLLVHAAEGVTGFELAVSGYFSSVGIWRLRQQITPEMESSAMHALERMEAAHLADREVSAMSSGEARRVQIARALVHRPLALLLDEPSANLDLAAQQELRDVLRRLTTEGTGLVLVTHHLGDIIPEVERIIFLKDGRVTDDGPKQELLTAGRLSSLFGVQVAVAERGGYYHAW
jgi:iron complex transport system ATP-binding protein